MWIKPEVMRRVKSNGGDYIICRSKVTWILTNVYVESLVENIKK